MKRVIALLTMTALSTAVMVWLAYRIRGYWAVGGEWLGWAFLGLYALSVGMKKTKIEWVDWTWNPITGCKNTCPYCYARKIAERFSGHVELAQEKRKPIFMKNSTAEIWGEPLITEFPWVEEDE